MTQQLNIEAFLLQMDRLPILDVRSPAEYRKGHIPVARSMPLFSDDERAEVGTLYKGSGRAAAIKKGLDIVGPKMSSLVDQAAEHKSNAVGLYCWRGGMRSSSVSWLLDQYGLDVYLLEGGYKSFRRSLMSFFDQPLSLKVITGYTGSRKTDLLIKIRDNGGQVIDLEGLAGHQGSSFGNQKSVSQPLPEHFQNLVYSNFRKLDISRPIYIEDECLRIGNVTLPEPLYQQMSRSDHVLIQMNMEERVEYLVKDYGGLQKEQLIVATEAIKRKLGREHAKRAVQMIHDGELEEAVKIILTYYDKRYQKSISAKEAQIVGRYDVDMSGLNQLAMELAGKNAD